MNRNVYEPPTINKKDERLKGIVWKAAATFEEKQVLASIYSDSGYKTASVLRKAKAAALKLATDLDKAIAILAPAPKA